LLNLNSNLTLSLLGALIISTTVGFFGFKLTCTITDLAIDTCRFRLQVFFTVYHYNLSATVFKFAALINVHDSDTASIFLVAR